MRYALRGEIQDGGSADPPLGRMWRGLQRGTHRKGSPCCVFGSFCRITKVTYPTVDNACTRRFPSASEIRKRLLLRCPKKCSGFRCPPFSPCCGTQNQQSLVSSLLILTTATHSAPFLCHRQQLPHSPRPLLFARFICRRQRSQTSPEELLDG